METKSLNEKHACPVSDRAERGVLMRKQERTGKRGWLRKKYLCGRKRGGVYHRGTHPPAFACIFFTPNFHSFVSQ